MVALYLRRNPQVALDAREDLYSPAVDGVVLDAVAYTHRSLLGEAATWPELVHSLSVQNNVAM